VGSETVYALEGSAFIAGAAVQWLRDGLGLIGSAAEIERLAGSVESSGGVVFVPALAGLGAPYWDADARGLISGITRGTTAAHLAYATLEGIAQEVTDLLEAMGDDLGSPIAKLRVDGGAAANNLLMQLQTDLSGVQVQRPEDLETTARGAAMLAAVGAGIVGSADEAARMYRVERSFQAQVGAQERQTRRQQWASAIARARV
jgi:glycerol kinase